MPIIVRFLRDKTSSLATLAGAVAILFFAFPFCAKGEQRTDSLRRWGLSLSGMYGNVLATDSYVKKWLRDKQCASFAAEWLHTALPTDSNRFAADYNYPTLSVGLRFAYNHCVTMQRVADPDWGLLQPVDFPSHLGNTLTAYFAFRRSLLRTKKFEAGYSLAAGVGFSRYKYNKESAPDNELIGSHWLIYFESSLFAAYHFTTEWALRGSLDFYHHSNGALNRPNKGANTFGPELSLIYAPYYKYLVAERKNSSPSTPFPNKRCYFNVSLGIGAKTLLEDWQKTQFNTQPTDPNYRTADFRLYLAYSLQTDFMVRYARRWASGVGFDLFYGTYADHVKQLDEAAGVHRRHSPWSVGIAAKHQAYYHNLSVAMAFGIYLFRHMGEQAHTVETPYYERIGLHYTFPSLHGLDLGINVKAHKTKADFTEFVVAFPIYL